MSDIFPPAEHIPAPPCRIDIVRYCKVANYKNRATYAVDFNGKTIGFVARRNPYSKPWEWTREMEGPDWGPADWSEGYFTRGEAAGALIRAAHPDWKGCAP